VYHLSPAIFAKKGSEQHPANVVIIINRLRQGRIAGFQGKNAAFDGIATVLGLASGCLNVIGCCAYANRRRKLVITPDSVS
jgi:hypothetical protein